MKISQIILAASFLALLSGCDASGDLQKGIDQANRIGDPYAAAKELESVDVRTHGNLSSTFMGNNDKVKQLYAQVKKSQEDLMIRAVEIGDDRAVYDLFMFDYYDSTELRLRAAPLVFVHADKPDASVEFLLGAGKIAYEGKYSQADYKRALEYFVRAWLMGSEYGADGAKTLFAQLEDNENAYLWSLRCMSRCSWDDSKIIKSPSPYQVLEIQRLALDKKILVLGNSPLSSVRVKP